GVPGELLPAADGGGEGRGVPAAEPVLVVRVPVRIDVRDPVDPVQGRGHGVDVLHAVQHDDGRPALERGVDGAGGVHPGVQLDLHGDELRGDGAQAASAGDGVV